MSQSTNKPSEKTIHMRSVLNKNDGDVVRGYGWNELYKVSITPWNLKKASPILVYATQLQNDQVKQIKFNYEKCFVPGCGEGYDVSYLSKFNGCKKSVGLDISQLVVDEANKLNNPDKSESIQFILDDFFSYHLEEDQKFTFAFDYTFFCAIHPNLRKRWAEQYSKLLTKGSLLVTGVFPLSNDPEELNSFDGPPYSVNFDSYKSVLGPVGFKCVVGPITVPDNVSVPQRVGREQLAIWQLN